MAIEEFFHLDESETLIGAAVVHSVTFMQWEGQGELFALQAALQSKTTETNTQPIRLVLHPGDAWAFAQQVMDVAKKLGWEFGLRRDLN